MTHPPNLPFQDYQQYIMLASSFLKQLDSSPGDSEILVTVVSSLKFILLKICDCPFLNTAIIINIQNIIDSGSPKNIVEIANTLTGHKTNPHILYKQVNDKYMVIDKKIDNGIDDQDNNDGDISNNNINEKINSNKRDDTNDSNISKNCNDKQLVDDEVDDSNDNIIVNKNDANNGNGVSDNVGVGDVDKFQDDDNKNGKNDCIDGGNDDDNESIRKQFEKIIFGYELSDQILSNKSNNKVVKPYSEYLNYVHVVQYWNSAVNPLNISTNQYRIYLNKQNNNNARKWANKYDTEFTGNGEPFLYDIRDGKRIVVHEDNLFDIVLQGHLSVGQKLGRTTWMYLKKIYSNITLEVCYFLLNYVHIATEPIIQKK